MKKLIFIFFITLFCYSSTYAQTISIPNPSFEIVKDTKGVPDNWHIQIGEGTPAKVEVDNQVKHSGNISIKISNKNPFQPFKFAGIATNEIPVKPNTTYTAQFFVKGKGAKKCSVGVDYISIGSHNMYLKEGNFDWEKFSFQFTTPERTAAIQLRFTSEDITEAFWVDDVSLEISKLQLANLKEKQYQKDFQGVFPRTPAGVAKELIVFDWRQLPNDDELELTLAALQGIVNRSSARLYMINKTYPEDYDEMWLKYIQEKGYTGAEKKVSDPAELLSLFKDEIKGAIVYDPDLPGSWHAAAMLSGIKNALPLSPKLLYKFKLPIIEDLRGKFKKNIEAYRYVYDNYFNQMNHYALAWFYPLQDTQHIMDYVVEFKIFTFWMSNYGDNEKGADPPAEESFINELFASTPGNVPVLGWPSYGDSKGIQEYTGVRWMSEYGKFMPGTGFCSNWSIHSAIHPPDNIFTQKNRKQEDKVKLEKDKVYVSINISDSGDSLWYWQFWQRKIWSDKDRGAVPIGWGMNVLLYETFPAILQWYYENATPNDIFFTLIYMNSVVYASRFTPEDKDRIWKEFVNLVDYYSQKLDIQGLELYNGAWNQTTPPTPQTFRYFTQGMKDLKFIFPDLGRHDKINATNANYILDNTTVFHCITRYQPWASSGEVLERKKEQSVQWLANEIKTNASKERPGFMNTWAVSWYFFPNWLKDLANSLPKDFVVVNPYQLNYLFREYNKTKEKTSK